MKKKTAARIHSRHFSLMLTDEEYNDLENAAAAMGIGKSTILRLALKKFICEEVK